MRPIFIEFWLIIQPLVQLLIATIGPIIVGWIVVRVNNYIRISDKNKALEFEARLRESLHASATNALKFLITKSGSLIDFSHALSAQSPILNDAIDYVRTKNPEAVGTFGLSNQALAEIILSKVPDLKASMNQASTSSRRHRNRDEDR